MTKIRATPRRSGFTLIELMVVIIIIAILSGIVLTAMNSSDNSRALDSGITRLDSLFSLARSAAITRKQKTRVLISLDSTNFDPNDPVKLNKPQRFLRYATIVYEEGDGNWKVYTEGEFLPDGIYFSPALSTKNAVGTSSEVTLNVWTLNIDPATLVISPQPPSDVMTSIGPFNLSGNDETISGAGAGKWYAFEFTPNGTFRNPGARVVLVNGVLQSATKLTIPTEEDVKVTDVAKGFVVFRSGKLLHFQAGEQIKEGN